MKQKILHRGKIQSNFINLYQYVDNHDLIRQLTNRANLRIRIVRICICFTKLTEIWIEEKNIAKIILIMRFRMGPLNQYTDSHTVECIGD